MLQCWGSLYYDSESSDSVENSSQHGRVSATGNGAFNPSPFHDRHFFVCLFVGWFLLVLPKNESA